MTAEVMKPHGNEWSGPVASPDERMCECGDQREAHWVCAFAVPCADCQDCGDFSCNEHPDNDCFEAAL